MKELKEYGITPIITDPVADQEEAKRIYGLEFKSLGEVKNMDAVIIAVAHDEFKSLTNEQIDSLYSSGKKVLLDIKGILNPSDFEKSEYLYWRL